MNSPAASSSGTFEFEPDATVSRVESSTPATSPPPNALSEYSAASSEVYDVGVSKLFYCANSRIDSLKDS